MKSLFAPILFPALAVALHAQPPSSATTSSAASTGAIVKLSPVVASATPSVADKYQLPQVTESVTAFQIEDVVNVMDTEDAVKYLPSIFLRKRNNGDTQAVMATRVWGVSSSARSLVYADGIPLTPLIANNNNIGGPRWGLVAPAEIERIDMMYGPFAAAYPGNSMGAVMEIATRLPERLESSLTQTEAWQHFSLYGTKDDYFTHQTSFSLGNRSGRFSFWVSGNRQDSHSQPLSYATSSTVPAGTTGIYPANNKLGQPANIAGAAGLLHTVMTNAKVKLAYDFTPLLRAAYTYGYWRDKTASSAETYLRDSAGQPTFAGLAGFASGTSDQLQEHSAHSLSLRTHTRGDWDFEANASLYRMDKDAQRLPASASATGTTFSTGGRVAVLGGTAWSTLDLKGTWRPAVAENAHQFGFGAHDDRYKLYNPTFNTPDWKAGGPYTSTAAEGDGKTRTQALWAQDLWQVSPSIKVTLGMRRETWRAYDGYNASGSTAVHQPTIAKSGWSPKGTLAWTPNSKWSATVSVGQAFRFATPAELYQLVTTGSTFTSPNPDLKPDDVLAAEIEIERKLESGRIRLSLFQDEIHDAIISQFKPLVAGSTQLFSYLSNVDHVRARGAELVVEKNDVFVPGLTVGGSATYLDARTLALSGQASATAPAGSAVGKRLPNIPEWRATYTITYRPNERWSFSTAGRYSGLLFTTLDNTDVNPNTYQGFAAWFVADARIQYRFRGRWTASVGADNLLNRKYFLFHPFPQRTVVAEGKFSF